MQSEYRTFLTAGGPLRSPLSADASTHLQETVISTLVAGMLPVIGSKSYTDDVSSSLSITSPSIMSIARARGGSGVIREAHSLAPAVRSESPVTPENRSETRRPPVRPGEAATSQMLKLERMERMERRAPSEGTPRRKKKRKRKRAHLVNSAQRKYLFFFLDFWDYCCAFTDLLDVTWRGGPLSAFVFTVCAQRSVWREMTTYT